MYGVSIGEDHVLLHVRLPFDPTALVIGADCSPDDVEDRHPLSTSIRCLWGGSLLTILGQEWSLRQADRK